MKKIKLFALAVMAMLGTNAMADEWANTTFTYEYASDADNAKASIKGFIQDYPAGDMEEVTIPNTVKSKTGKTLKVDKILTKAFQNNTNIKKVTFSGANLSEIETLAFDGCTALAEVSFTAATGLTTIGADAFGKAPIVTFDLSTTKVATVEKLFGTDFDNADETKRVINTTLTTVKLSNVWATIKEEAFAGCTALATVNFGTVPTTGAPASQVFEASKDYMFAGCPITSLNFAGTLVTELPAGLLLDGTIYTKNESLTSVTLTENFTALNAALKNCVNLATLTGYIKVVSGAKTSALNTLVNNEFQNDEKLTSFDLACVTTLGDYSFAGTGLTSVTFPKNKIATIPEGCFMDCENLTTVTWDAEETSTSGLALIEEKAFANTGLTTIIIPAGALSDADNKIEENAFAYNANLTSFVWKWAGTVTKTPVNVNAFKGLSEEQVTFYTLDANHATTSAWVLPTNCKWGNPDAAPGTTLAKLTMTAYKNGTSKYYYKLEVPAGKNYAIAKGDAKVYDAYADFTDDNGALNMISYKPLNGFYQIPTGNVCLVISDKAEVEYVDGNGDDSSMASSFDATNDNALFIQATDISRTSLMLDATLNPNNAALYGWMNTASGVGFQKIGSGKTIPAGSLLAFAAEPASGRLTINWYDENGNLENQTTAIAGVENEASEAEGESFNLAGQKVAAGSKGIIIKNGKKVIVK